MKKLKLATKPSRATRSITRRRTLKSTTPSLTKLTKRRRFI